ncbi:MAG TPA: UxaA family hydrolase [Firmicutes bacterium]|nr:UxaA family hydrolase [Bacillota bacterium]
MVREALQIDQKDNVGIALRPLKAGTLVSVNRRGGDEIRVSLLDDIPFGHKFALRRIQAGEHVIKYGETIGMATQHIERGQHVHTHNVASLRGRGDKR